MAGEKLKPTRVRAMPNDVGEWGEKDDRGSSDYQEPFKVAGEAVNLDELPKFGGDGSGSSGQAKAPVRPG